MLSLCVIVFSVAIIIGIIIFAIQLYKKTYIDWIKNNTTFCLSSLNTIEGISEILSETEKIATQFLEKRNEYWLFFSQIIIAAVIAIVITVLLIENKIESVAGVPLLSALGSFTIAKGVSTNFHSVPK